MNDLATQETQLDDKTLFSLVTDGDASKLSDANKLAYYKARCDAAGLDYRAQPFAFIKLNGKLVLYALKACTDQLAGKHGVRCEIVDQRTEDGIRVVTVRASTKDGRATDEIGVVSVKGLTGDNLCNALMKAATKAKRRAILSVCGLGMTDESEMETIPGAQAQLARAPSVKMPTTRLADRPKSEPEPEIEAEPVEDAAGSRFELEPDLEQQLDDSLKLISREQNVKLWATLGSSPHSELDFRDWLQATAGLDSTKLIPKTKLDAIIRRLEQPEPLHHDYEDVAIPCALCGYENQLVQHECKPKARFVRRRP